MVDSAQREECLRIEENSTYSAETHHVLAKACKLQYTVFQLVPAIATAIAGTLTVGQVVPRWVGVAGLVTAVITAIGTVLNPQRGYHQHSSAAKAFTALKHDARLAREFGDQSVAGDFAASARCLHDRYNDLVRSAPLTHDWAFKRARKRIHAGVHAPDENI